MALLPLGCDEEQPAETTQANSGADLVATDDTATDDVEAEAEPVEGEASGNVEGEPFSVRGVLAKPIAREKIEVRLFNRSVSCESFDSDYELSEDEKVIVVILRWPKEAGDTIALGASNTDDFFQFCHGRASGRASCNPRAAEQGSLSVVEAREDGGELAVEVASDQGALSGNVEFTLCR